MLPPFIPFYYSNQRRSTPLMCCIPQRIDKMQHVIMPPADASAKPVDPAVNAKPADVAPATAQTSGTATNAQPTPAQPAKGNAGTKAADHDRD